MEKEFTPTQKRFALAQLSTIGVCNGQKNFNFQLDNEIKFGDNLKIIEVNLTKPLVVAKWCDTETNIEAFKLSDEIINAICDEMEQKVLSLIPTEYINLV